MLIQEKEEEEEEESKRPFGGGPKSRADGKGRAKDRSALRRFSPLVVKRGYKAQRDGLGESCTRFARLRSRSPTRPIAPLVFVSPPPAPFRSSRNGSIVFDAPI